MKTLSAVNKPPLAAIIYPASSANSEPCPIIAGMIEWRVRQQGKNANINWECYIFSDTLMVNDW